MMSDSHSSEYIEDESETSDMCDDESEEGDVSDDFHNDTIQSQSTEAESATVEKNKTSMLVLDEERRESLIQEYKSLMHAADKGNLDAVRLFVEMGQEVRMVTA